jgi:hypothetical protein
MLKSEDWAKCAITKAEISKWINQYAKEAYDILEDVSNYLNIIVKLGLPHVSSTKGVGGSTYDHELLDITFDVALPLGVEKFCRYLRETIFHEMNHVMFIRYNPRQERQLYWAVLEGLGTVFDRDYAGGEHFTRGGENYTSKIATESEMRDWLKLNLKASTRSPNVPIDWVGMTYQVGVWLVDRAIKNSGKNVIELSHLSCDELLKLASI